MIHTKINCQKNDVSPEHKALLFFYERLQAYALPPLLRFLSQIALLIRFKIPTCKRRQDGCGGLVISSNKSWCYMKALSKIWHIFLMNKLFFILVKTFQFIEAPGQQLGWLRSDMCSKPGFNSKAVRGWDDPENRQTNLLTKQQANLTQNFAQNLVNVEKISAGEGRWVMIIVSNKQGARVFNWRGTRYF